MPSSYEIEKPRSREPRGDSHSLARPDTHRKSLDRKAVRRLVRLLSLWSGARHVREAWDWARCRHVSLPNVAELRKTLAALDQNTSQRQTFGENSESPIFLLATGWRTGSTLLQRILVTDQRLLLWGEPFGEMALISTLTESLARLSNFPNLSQLWSGEGFTASSETSVTLAKSWIATLYPAGADLRAALRALLTQWFAKPAIERGFSRWGFKEVRLGAAEAMMLHWLYPQAKFVILSRHPFDCYRSLADSGWHHVYHRRPDIRVDSAAGLSRHWNRLALSWGELPPEFPAIHIKYEDLIQGKVDFRALELWLGIEIKEDAALSVAVGHTAVRTRLNWFERFIITREADRGMRALGYLK